MAIEYPSILSCLVMAPKSETFKTTCHGTSTVQATCPEINTETWPKPQWEREWMENDEIF